jgi:hypothetical protein
LCGCKVSFCELFLWLVTDLVCLLLINCGVVWYDEEDDMVEKGRHFIVVGEVVVVQSRSRRWPFLSLVLGVC